MLDVEKAKEELSKIPYTKIQEQTAWTWASRACACYQKSLEKDNNKLEWFVLGEEYFHEAQEHAALTETDTAPSLLKAVKTAVIPYQEKAAQTFNAGASDGQQSKQAD